MIKYVQYASGHYCQSNGLGDFDFFCPELGKRTGFVPYLIGIALLKGTCACGKAIEKMNTSLGVGHSMNRPKPGDVICAEWEGMPICSYCLDSIKPNEQCILEVQTYKPSPRIYYQEIQPGRFARIWHKKCREKKPGG